jgi:GDPmannose 4,6-dehydratase
MKTALVTGIRGQDGSYLAEHLAGLGYRVYGLVRSDAEPPSWLAPIAHRVELVRADMRDEASLDSAFQKARPDEVYNLAGPRRGSIRRRAPTCSATSTAAATS